MPEPAAELRAAAQRLRTLAEAIPTGQWVANGRLHSKPLDSVSNIATADGLALMMSGTTGRDILARPAVLDYLLAMHPGVALALAAHLDAYADRLEHPIVMALAKMGGKSSLRDAAETETSTALDLARLVLEAK